MRPFLALFLACSMLCSANVDASAAGLATKRDRIVIFHDDSAAFAAFSDRVLRDREVATFMSQNFEIYPVEVGSPEAAAMPLFGGARWEPRIVVSAPRLDNATLVLQPVISKANFLKILQRVQRATTQEDIVLAIGGFASPSSENMTAWARDFYPAITEPGSVPAGLLLGFLISEDLKVRQHSAAISQAEGSMLEQLRRMMPLAAIPERPASSGASCFGGMDPKAKYCVTWALVSK